VKSINDLEKSFKVSVLPKYSVYIKKRRVKMQTDLTFDWVNSTKLKDWINILSSFPTKNTKPNHIENIAYWLKTGVEIYMRARYRV
jgi:hypothetical protein